MKTKLTEQSYWVNAQVNINLNLADDNLIKLWIESNLNFTKIRNCIEIGFFQRITRLLFDYKNYKMHNINSMDFEKRSIFLETPVIANHYQSLSFVTELGVGVQIKSVLEIPQIFENRKLKERIFNPDKYKFSEQYQKLSSYFLT